ncbi:hypothetical protein MASR1M65_04070 [Saprospiraceae bacterium]
MPRCAQILDILKRTYCGTFALQYMHISDPEQAAWLKERIEGYGKEIAFTREGRKAILNKLVEAEGYEKFLHVKYMGTKRFGLDGGEALIPAMEQIIKRGGQLGVRDIIIGMPHRGRLNVLANVLMKPYRAIFNEFQGGSYKPEDVDGSGDVKYHLGASADREFDGNKVHLSLTANPSHLEAVNPVVLGKARAKQDQLNDIAERIAPCCRSCCTATRPSPARAWWRNASQLSGIKGHRTGGCIHIIVNNQIGFTTAPPSRRTSPYPTDIALMVEAPIFHVNGDDPEAVVHAAKVATEFRQKFHKDVVLDMFCYRRFGHNEGDEPMFTNPAMYKPHPHAEDDAPALYRAAGRRRADPGRRDRGHEGRLPGPPERRVRGRPELQAQQGRLAGRALDGHADQGPGRTTSAARPRSPPKTLAEIGAALTRVPEGFHLHKTVARQLDAKREDDRRPAGASTGQPPRRWPSARSAGRRLPGPPCPARTAPAAPSAQRHSALIDQDDRGTLLPARTTSAPARRGMRSSTRCCRNMPCWASNMAIRWPNPTRLTLWEAQFGDFANGAQIMFDQFINSGESKWLRMSGLVVPPAARLSRARGRNIPRARLERFLQLSAEDNWIVANCSTPANYFHVLRRQMHRDFRKPLILMTPKSLLRHPMCDQRHRRFHHRLHLPPRALGRCAEGQSEAEAEGRHEDPPRRPVLGQGLLRPSGRTRRRGHRRCLPPARSNSSTRSRPWR